MKRTLICLLLALLMCMTVVLSSCKKDEEPTPQEDTTPVAAPSGNAPVDEATGKAMVVEYLKAYNASALVNEETISGLEDAINEIKFGGDFSVDGMAEQAVDMSFSMKDGLMYMSAMGEEMFALISGTDVLSFEKNEMGEWFLVGGTEEDEKLPAPMASVESDSAMAEMEPMFELLKALDFKKITAADVSLVDGKYVVSNDFLVKTYVNALVELYGEDVSEAEINEVIAEYKEMLNQIKFSFGFKVVAAGVTEMIVSVDVDAAAMVEMGMAAEGANAYAKISLTTKLGDQGKTVKGMSASVDINVPNEMSYKGTLGADFILKDGQIAGVDMTVSLTSNGMTVGYEEKGDDYIAVYGDQTLSVKLYSDDTAMAKGKGTKAMSAEFSFAVKNIKAEGNATIDAKNYEQSIKGAIEMKVETLTKVSTEGSIEVDVPSMGDKMNITVSGSGYVNEAPNFPATIPGIVQDYMN